MIQSYNCPNCGAPVDKAGIVQQLATCPYCQSIFRIHTTLTPEPTLGDLILGADFSQRPMPGWVLQYEDNLRFTGSPQPALIGKFAAKPGVFHLLTTSGQFDDTDVSVTIRFLDGVPGQSFNAGLFVRYAAGQGGYGAFISSNQRVQIGYYYQKDGVLNWGTLVRWSDHHALRGGLHVDNRLRVVMRGKRLSVYLNGVIASSIENDLFQHGEIRLSAEPTDQSHIEVAFSDLQVRAALKA